MQIFDLFDLKQRGVIDFGDFVRALNVFHPNVSQEDKIDCKLLSCYKTLRFRQIFFTISTKELKCCMFCSFIQTL